MRPDRSETTPATPAQAAAEAPAANSAAPGPPAANSAAPGPPAVGLAASGSARPAPSVAGGPADSPAGPAPSAVGGPADSPAGPAPSAAAAPAADGGDAAGPGPKPHHAGLSRRRGRPPRAEGKRPGRPNRKSAYLPPQHGAWAFLGLPLVLGAIVAPGTPLLMVLAIAWVAAYPLSYAALGLVRARRPQRFRAPFAVWLAVVLPAVVVLVVARPWLIWVGLGYLALFAVNFRYAQRNDERALVNDLVFVAECAAMVAVAWAVGAGERSWSPPALHTVPHRVWVLVIVCALVLVGSTLHVKSLIRERRDLRYARSSRVAAVVLVPAAGVLAGWWGLPRGAWLVVPFVALAVRAFLVGRPLRPGRIGVIELGCFVLVALGCLLASL